MQRLVLSAIITMLAICMVVPAWGLDPPPLPPSPFDALSSFHKAVGDFFGFQDPVLKQVLKAGLPDEELPVALFIATLSGVSPNNIIAVRKGGTSWMDVCLKFGITGDRFYVPVGSGPPYGKAWGYYSKPKSEWKSMQFSDTDIINLVNLRFMTGYYGYASEEVMNMRDRGEGFVAIHQKAQKEGKGPKGSLKGGAMGSGNGGHPGNAPRQNGPKGTGKYK